jgi:1-acyl-sn-glycerol-3-phosphate acyltransferase
MADPLPDDDFRPPTIDDPVPDEVLAVLAPLERFHLELALRMNREPAKRFWTALQRYFGAIVIRLLTRNVVQVHGFEHLVEARSRGTVLLVANHRTYFDMFVVSSLIHRRIPGRKRLYFPVTGLFYYQSITGLLLNLFGAFWSMFPPLFALPSHRVSDKYALDLLIDLCSRGPGYFLGIHPEGGRNRNPDPWSYLRFQPGTGKIIHAARPIVVPTFIVGLDNDVTRQVARNWNRTEPVRVWFAPPMDFSELLALPAKASTYKAITDAVMEQVKILGSRDRSLFDR